MPPKKNQKASKKAGQKNQPAQSISKVPALANRSQLPSTPSPLPPNTLSPPPSERRFFTSNSPLVNNRNTDVMWAAPGRGFYASRTASNQGTPKTPTGVEHFDVPDISSSVPEFSTPTSNMYGLWRTPRQEDFFNPPSNDVSPVERAGARNGGSTTRPITLPPAPAAPPSPLAQSTPLPMILNPARPAMSSFASTRNARMRGSAAGRATPALEKRAREESDSDTEELGTEETKKRFRLSDGSMGSTSSSESKSRSSSVSSVSTGYTTPSEPGSATSPVAPSPVPSTPSTESLLEKPAIVEHADIQEAAAVDSQARDNTEAKAQVVSGENASSFTEPTASQTIQGDLTQPTNHSDIGTVVDVDPSEDQYHRDLLSELQRRQDDTSSRRPGTHAEGTRMLAQLMVYRLRDQMRASPLAGTAASAQEIVPPTQTAASPAAQPSCSTPDATVGSNQEHAPPPQIATSSPSTQPEGRSSGSDTTAGAVQPAPARTAVSLSSAPQPRGRKLNAQGGSAANHRPTTKKKGRNACPQTTSSQQTMTVPPHPPSHSIGQSTSYFQGQISLSSSAPAQPPALPQLPWFRMADETFVPLPIPKEKRQPSIKRPVSPGPAPSETHPAPPLSNKKHIWCGHRAVIGQDEAGKFIFKRCTTLLLRDPGTVKLHYLQFHGNGCNWSPSCGRKASHIWEKHIMGSEKVCEGKHCGLKQATGSDWCAEQRCGCIAPILENDRPDI